MENKKSLVFVIEDEESISKLICLYLSKSDINTKAFYNAEDALKELENGTNPDLIILDLNLPGISGFEFLERIKKSSKIPNQNITILSARDADEDIIKGLDIGADEFITKPFSPSVLVARIKANLRRNSLSIQTEDIITFGEYTILLNSCVLKKGSKKIPLSNKEYEVLEYLAKNPNISLSPETIYSNVWKVEFGDITAVAVYVQRLRKKIEENPNDCKYIKTDFGKGYIFCNE
ncbi:MAG: response regulator transcription factor [Treponema bryantii]|nr:response regulator transcription factor [Treponema bryantii]